MVMHLAVPRMIDRPPARRENHQPPDKALRDNRGQSNRKPLSPCHEIKHAAPFSSLAALACDGHEDEHENHLLINILALGLPWVSPQKEPEKRVSVFRRKP
jgi:hypothetical protein